MRNPQEKLITRSFSCATMRDRFEAAGAKEVKVVRGCNNVTTTYAGEFRGIPYEVVFDFTRHMGDFTTLRVDRDNFSSMAELVRYYREIKAATTHNRWGAGANVDWSK